MPSVEKIKCPSCGTEIDVSRALSAEIEARFKTEAAAANTRHIAEIEKLKKEKDEIKNAVVKEAEKDYAARLQTASSALREEVMRESEERFLVMQKSLEEKSKQVIELNKTRAENEKLKLEKDEIEFKIAAAKDAELAKKLKEERDANKSYLAEELLRIKRDTAEEGAARLQESMLKIAELQKKLEDQTVLAEEMKRKAEQGSTQLQGEVMELAIEDVLRDMFRFDVIEPVPKGINGADVIQRVRNSVGKEAGVIAYEIKRTKAFSKDWISKLKEDGARVKADICVLITETLPSDTTDKVSQKDGVWICAVPEFRALSLVLRDSIIKLDEAFSSQTNKGEKMQMLYDYLTGKEFSAQFTTIIEGFTDLQQGYLEERNRMEKIWKMREKQLEKILLNTNGFIGAIKGIAGNSLPMMTAIDDGGRSIPEPPASSKASGDFALLGS